MIEIPHEIPIYVVEINAALIRTAEDEWLEDLDTTYEKLVEKREWLAF